MEFFLKCKQNSIDIYNKIKNLFTVNTIKYLIALIKNNYNSILSCFLYSTIILLMDYFCFHKMKIRHIMASLSIVFLTLILYKITKLIKYSKLRKLLITFYGIILFFFIFIFMIFGIHCKTKNIILNIETIQAVLQTNILEIYEFLKSNDLLLKFLFVILFCLFLSIYFSCSIKKTKIFENKNYYSLFFMILLTIVACDKIQSFRIADLSYSSIIESYLAIKEYEKFQKEFDKNTNLLKYESKKEETGELYILIIGESNTKDNMSLYGYFRNTTPFLNQLKNDNNTIIFNNAYSTHTHTVPTLQYFLTEANQYNNKEFTKSVNLIDILNKSNFNTIWISNQADFGAWDTPISGIKRRTKTVIQINKNYGKTTNTTNYDLVIIDEAKKFIKNWDGKSNTFMILHLMGNHSNYSNRYPKDFEIFNDLVSIQHFKDETDKQYLRRQRMLNDYDNSIYYVDYLINQLFSFVKETKNNELYSIIYIPDHGEDVVNDKGHESSLFTYRMSRIPFITYVSDKYKERYPDIFSKLKNSSDKIFTNDLTYDYIINLTNIKTNTTSDEFFIGSDNYKINESNALTLYSRKNIKEDPLLKSINNNNYLTNKYINKNFLAHRNNVFGKIMDAKRLNFVGLEIDLMFKDNKLIVGHDDDSTNNQNFEEILQFLKENNIQNKQILLDVKNITTDNIEAIIKILNDFDKKYELKNKVIIESKITTIDFVKLKENGFYTSYYLPTQKLLAVKTSTEFELIAKEIAEQIKIQGVSAVSFDVNLYDFVKNYLEKYIESNIAYLLWDLKNNLEAIEINDYEKNQYLKDDRVKTILLPFASDFYL